MTAEGHHSAAVAELENRTGIVRTELSGTGIAVRYNDTVYVWQDSEVSLAVTMFPLEDPGEHELCLDVHSEENNSTTHKSCRTMDVQETGSRTTFETRVSANATGPHDLVLTLEDFDANQTTSVPVVVITRDGDIDGDSLNNSQEIEHGTGIDDQDTDGDGLLDGLEVSKYGTNPKLADSDQDGLTDGRELNLDTDPMNRDTDGDGLTDGREINLGTDPTKRDTDDDGLSDTREIELGTDPTEEDTDTDGLSDAREIELGTDPTDPDTDDDGINDGTEVERGSDPLDPDDPGMLSGPAMMYVIGGGTIVAGLVLAVSYVRRRDVPETPETPEPSDGPDAGATEGDDSVDPELLSPEQHVMHLLERNAGQMKQSQIVEETDWSKAKVSRKLSRLEEEGEIKRTRIGRENVVSYPDRDLGEET